MNKEHTYVIAEAGVNHNGALSKALEMVEVAAQSGADAVKFQTFRAEQVVIGSAAKAAYQAVHTDAHETQLEMLQRLELDLEANRQLIAHANKWGIQFLSTPFDFESADMLVDALGVRCIKIGSGEITNAPLLLHIAQHKPAIILSTGMSSLGEVEDALGVLAFGFLATGATPSVECFRRAYQSPEGQDWLREKVSLLHCTTEYPAPFSDVNLAAMETLSKAFGLPVGISDHTVGYSIAIAAVALGAAIVEKHFTLDRGLPGPDHRASLEPNELAAMITAIRQVESAIGSTRKLVTPSEESNREVARKSLVSLKTIRTGELFSAENLGIKRPGTGLSPHRYWELLGTASNHDYAADEVILP